MSVIRTVQAALSSDVEIAIDRHFQFLRFSGLPAWVIEFYDDRVFKGSVTGQIKFSSALNLNSGATNQFIGWSGDAVSAANPLVLTLDTSKVLTANFGPAFFALEILQQGGNVPHGPTRTSNGLAAATRGIHRSLE